MTDPSSLIAQLYHAKYYSNSTFLNSSLGTNPNYTWRSIWVTRDLLWKHSRWHVGDGSQIFLKQDPWLLIQSQVLLVILLVQILIM